ncbi:MAG: hypothetical protein J07HR59_01709 [Halorubrum sp. J07HR59]|nr:MAG: hypothetical protein J07HR59_01709 [Halorubrum sp. J07HR59]
MVRTVISQPSGSGAVGFSRVHAGEEVNQLVDVICLMRAIHSCCDRPTMVLSRQAPASDGGLDPVHGGPMSELGVWSS